MANLSGYVNHYKTTDINLISPNAKYVIFLIIFGKFLYSEMVSVIKYITKLEYHNTYRKYSKG